CHHGRGFLCRSKNADLMLAARRGGLDIDEQVGHRARKRLGGSDLQDLTARAHAFSKAKHQGIQAYWWCKPCPAPVWLGSSNHQQRLAIARFRGNGNTDVQWAALGRNYAGMAQLHGMTGWRNRRRNRHCTSQYPRGEQAL